jgi:hypothetical protein
MRPADGFGWLPSAASAEATAELLTVICQAADLCRPGLSHAAVLQEQAEDGWCLRLECRDRDGRRLDREDLDLEIYGAAADPSIQITWSLDPQSPMLWQGRHALWMEPGQGQRCAAPPQAIPLEALARRLRARLVEG